MFATAGSEEYDKCMQELIDLGLAHPLKKRKHSHSFRSNPSDVARVEDRTFISYPNEIDAGPTNHWMNPRRIKENNERLI